MQVAKDLQSYLTSSRINTDELKNKLRDDSVQKDLIQPLQQALSSLQVPLLESVLGTSTSFSYEQQKVADVLQIADKLSIALSLESISQTAIIDPRNDELHENAQTEITMDGIILDSICKTEVQENKPMSSSQNSQLILQARKHQSLLEVVDEFVDCFSELSDDSNETFVPSTLNKSIDTKIPETVFIETTNPFEEFFDSATAADKLPSAECIATNVGEISVLEDTCNLEITDKSTELAIIGFSDEFPSAVTSEINVSEGTKIREGVVVLSDFENLLSENINPISIGENATDQHIAIEKNYAVYYDTEPVVIKEAVIIDNNSDTTNQKDCPVSEIIITETTLAEKSPSVEINADVIHELVTIDQINDITKKRDNVISFATENVSESPAFTPTYESNENKKNEGTSNFNVAFRSEVKNSVLSQCCFEY